jgi:hypothetical protein
MDRARRLSLSLRRSDRVSESYPPRPTGAVSARDSSERSPSGAVAKVAYDDATEAGGGGYELREEGPEGLSSMDREGFRAEVEETTDSARRLEDEDFLRPSSLLLLRLHMVMSVRGHARGASDGREGGGGGGWGGLFWAC